jgi:hypothetical protein
MPVSNSSLARTLAQSSFYNSSHRNEKNSAQAVTRSAHASAGDQHRRPTFCAPTHPTPAATQPLLDEETREALLSRVWIARASRAPRASRSA